ncbi:hypothetical protein AURDEDRAFT_177323 [Auricularia subglabra TFB-10046 SS5]|uniref:Uncharacterized protein n=1 Tax=Auricularia subglabra (strain TFB-10046 / SS5) TaxID=717982 RepID=J0CTG4_AURST|nr:hypothetical protein AURDEDRAFT_177323 [Auricularia subglabra TFB-10046 SS5]
MSTPDAAASVSGDVQANPAEATVRAYTAAELSSLSKDELIALVNLQKELWPFKSGQNKWHAVRKPNMDVMRAVLLDPVNGFTTAAPPPKEHTGRQVKRPSKSLAQSKRVTSDQKEDYVAQSVSDGSMRPSAVVLEGRRLGIKPAVPAPLENSAVPPVFAPALPAPAALAAPAVPGAQPPASQAAVNGEQGIHIEPDDVPQRPISRPELPVASPQDHNPSDSRVSLVPIVPPALVNKSMVNAVKNLQPTPAIPAELECKTSDPMEVVQQAVARGSSDLSTNPTGVISPAGGQAGTTGLSHVDLAQMLQTNDANVLSNVSVSYGDFSQDILNSAWKLGETLDANVTIYIHDLRTDEKTQQDIELPVTHNLLGLKTVLTTSLITALQASMDPIQGTAKVSLKLPNSDYLASVAMIRDGSFDGKCQRAALELQEGLALSVSLVVNEVGGLMGLKRGSEAIDHSTSKIIVSDASRTKANAAAARRYTGAYNKRVKKEDDASDADSSAKTAKNDLIAAWLRTELKQQDGYEDFNARRGSQNLSDKVIVSSCQFVKAFVDKYNNRLVSGDIVPGLPKPCKVAKANIWAALDRAKTWGAPQEDPEVVERYNNQPVVPEGFAKLKDFCRDVVHRNEPI